MMLKSMGLDVAEIERQAGEFMRGLVERLDRLEAQNKEILARLEAQGNGGNGQEICLSRSIQNERRGYQERERDAE